MLSTLKNQYMEKFGKELDTEFLTLDIFLEQIDRFSYFGDRVVHSTGV
jgi:hypothetical protein